LTWNFMPQWMQENAIMAIRTRRRRRKKRGG
jgi:hypothetical protein